MKPQETSGENAEVEERTEFFLHKGKLQPPTRTGSLNNTSATQNSKLKRPFMADCYEDISATRAITSKISDFGFEMQDSSDFKIS